MTEKLLVNMPAALNEITDAKETWTALAKMVENDDKPVVTLKPGDKLIDGLELLTTLSAATVEDKDGDKVVTLLLETAPAAPAPKAGVKEAAAAQSSFAAKPRRTRRDRA